MVVGRGHLPVVHDTGDELCVAAKGREPELTFVPVSEGKTSKNRLHIDLAPDDQDAEIVYDWSRRARVGRCGTQSPRSLKVARTPSDALAEAACSARRRGPPRRSPPGRCGYDCESRMTEDLQLGDRAGGVNTSQAEELGANARQRPHRAST